MKLNKINIKNYFSAIKEFFTNKKYKIFYYNFILSILCLFAFFTPDYILKIAGAWVKPMPMESAKEAMVILR